MDDNKAPASIVGMAWYLEVEFDEIKSIMVDGDTAYTLYEEWLQSARRSEHHQIQAGHRVIRATIHPKAFKAWCKARELPLDAASRKLFATTYAQEAAAQGQ